MPWLVAENGKVLASAEVADSFGQRLKGLLGREGLTGALVIPGTKSVHTLFMRFPIDVAFCDRDLNVLRVRTVRRWRVCRPCWGAHYAIEAEAGSFERWGLVEGHQLELRS